MNIAPQPEHADASGPGRVVYFEPARELETAGMDWTEILSLGDENPVLDLPPNR